MALNNVPLTGQSLNVTKVPINQNFSVIDTAFSVDHVSYNTTGQGKHNKVSFPLQAVAPVFLAGEEGLYNVALGGVSELYVHKQSAAGTKEIPMTASTLSTSTPGSAVGGWTWLPSGYYETWGSGNGNGLTTVTLTTPPPNIMSNVIVCPFANATVFVNLQIRLVNIISRSQFRVFVSVNGVAASGGFSFRVIGY